MKLTELIKDAQEVLAQNGDIEVILSKDGEGNQFSPLSGYDLGKYAATTTWYGEYYSFPEEGEEAEERDPDEDYSGPPDDAVMAMVLWPVN